MKYIVLFLMSWLIISCHSTKSRFTPYKREALKERTFNFFWELAHTQNYQIPDRYPTLTFSSIAATGFGLSSYLVGIENGYISRDQGADRVLNTLQFLWQCPQGSANQGIAGYNGFYYHFLTLDEAIRFKNVELSSIDTGLLMAGILSVQSYFDGNSEKEEHIRTLADSLYLRVDWKWMLNEHNRLSMGWHPESGFISSDWRGYNEAMVLLVMAIGSPSHPIPASTWSTWCETYHFQNYMGQNHIQFDPLFGHQYSHIWIDFRGIRDPYMKSKNSDYFENSRKATITNKAYCLSNPGSFKGYGQNCWGLTACDGPYNGKLVIDGKTREFFDYRARGASSMHIVDDGTIAPTAAGGSFPFLPQACEEALQNMWNTYESKLVGKYGYKDAFNPTFVTSAHPDGWFGVDYLGIDQGPILLQIQNHETELIWKTMKKNKYIVNGLKKAGFDGGWLDQTK
ncbi:MAG: Tat pathway signal protein [Saprospiraceae bacterium]|nr:Tat pathway signal protein [Saprospiraceae bacterium]